MKLNKSRINKKHKSRIKKHKSRIKKHKSRMNKKHKSRMNKKHKSRMNKKTLKNKKLKINNMKGGFISSPASYPPTEHVWNQNSGGLYYKYNNNPVVPLNYMISTTNTL